MKAREILAKKGHRVVTIRADASIETAIHRLALERIGALVVSEDGERVEGIVSERDIIRALAEEGASILGPGRRVAEIMTTAPRTCSPEDSVKDLMDRMTRFRVRHLPVVENGRLVGIVSIGDVVKNRLEEMELETNVLRDVVMAGH
ncbi:MAG: CBS domain-containing protein [Geminicoccaceae bacterium]|nr:CBS domain-containing protein [Geminicoccaceae bacterium]MCX7630431.1 CBS domain-containing protein [Geminicoccaceae bacterium]MDW8341045.1 CBS domain-containing protein [Geminicoccaceae bacterium]